MVLSRTARSIDGADVVRSVDEAKALIGDGVLMIIGGAELYRLVLPDVDVLHLTRVEADVDGDVSFPTWSEDDWREVSAVSHDADDRHDYAYTFRTLRRRVG
jgi:dihydrofolate reductase